MFVPYKLGSFTFTFNVADYLFEGSDVPTEVRFYYWCTAAILTECFPCHHR